MKILAVADVESKALWDFFYQNSGEKYDLIISAGDLNSAYLSFLTTMFRCDVLYVPGNHDKSYLKHPPEGCINIDGKIIEYQGLRIMGLGGSFKYNSDLYQYTEKEMRNRMRRLIPQLIKHKGVDIFVTHAPAKGIHDGADLPHFGFACFRKFLEKVKPKYFIHGHVHMNYGSDIPRVDYLGDTTIINAYERYVLDL